MKNKIITLILTLVLILSMSMVVFAGDWYSNDVKSITKDSSLNEVGKYFSWNDYNYVYIKASFNNYSVVSPVSKNAVLVRERMNEYGAYFYAPYIYNEDTKTLERYYYEESINVCIGTSKFYGHDTNACAINDFSVGDLGSYTCETNAPYCINQEYALLYFQTMDAQYLENAGDFIEVPKPINASLYLASEENALYVYYENEDFSLSSDTITRLWGNYRYRNASGEDIVISAIPQVDVEYVNRNQLKVDLSVLNEYDTGNVFIVLNNVWNDSVDSDWIGFEYRKGSNSYYIFDVVNGEASNLREVVITDYGNVNNSYTGGTVGNITTNIPSANQGDYSFLGGLFNGFGLLGDNGLIALLTQTFSYVPKEIFIMVGAGISAGIVVALIKWLFN